MDTTLAARNAVLAMIDWLVAERGLTREQAYVLCSVAVDLRISEIVDIPNPVVSALCPLDIFHATTPKTTEPEMTDTDHDLYARQGIGSQIGFGDAPAVVVVDYQLAFTRGAAGGRLPRGRAARDRAHLRRRARAGRTRHLLLLRLRGGSLGCRPVRRQVPGPRRLPARLGGL